MLTHMVGVEVQLHSFLTSAPDGGSSGQRLGGFIPGRRLLGGSVGPQEPISNRDFFVVYFGTVG